MSVSTFNSALNNYISAKNTYNGNRGALLSNLAGYKNNLSFGLLIRSSTGTEFWIIFVKSSTLTPTSGTSYDLALAGKGMHLTLNSAMENGAFLTNCNTLSGTTNITGQISTFEFFGGSSGSTQMKLSNVVQKNTVNQSDDISDIDEISLGQFRTLCNGLASNQNVMIL